MTTLCMCDFVELAADEQRQPLPRPTTTFAARAADKVQRYKDLGPDPFASLAVRMAAVEPIELTQGQAQ